MNANFVLAATFSVCFLGCNRPPEQNFDVFVGGQVTDESNNPQSGVKVYIDRGTSGNWSGPTWEGPDDSLLTNQQGAYSYTILDGARNPHQLYIEVKAPYTSSEPYAQAVNRDIVDSRTQPNTINFMLKR